MVSESFFFVGDSGGLQASQARLGTRDLQSNIVETAVPEACAVLVSKRRRGAKSGRRTKKS